MSKFLRMGTISAAVSLAVAFFGSEVKAAPISSFADGYDVSNWTVSASFGGSVNTTGAPSSIVVIEPNSGFGGAIASFTTVALGTGTFSFDWDYGGNDCGWASALVYNNGSSVLANSCTSGNSYSAQVNAGDIIGFGIRTFDGILGSTTLSISNFTAPSELTPVPLPAAGWMLFSGFGALAFVGRRRRRLNQ
ncbi:VPLPA-CTERM sorting domain-containing protein [uncultured Marivita sp.]|uniref:VPLPA-CTERM sorting domain-containing protein n=1 Tax=uncultured Marivita sp. TaxID=888080 RepID=UPI0026042222|nr:VPLPA-CTERM sorting domain-containing protein [uncultured Marivita sp.]